MRVSTSARLWRWPVLVLVMLVAVACVLVFRNDSMYLPGADGRRYARQFVVAWMPVLGAVLLIDPTPEITATLPRARRVYVALRAAMVVGVLVPLVLAWFLSDQLVVKALYEAFIVAVLITCSIIAVSLWQASGVLMASLLSVLWLLAGDTLAMVLGFADITGQAMRVAPVHWGLALAGLGLAAVATLRGAGSTRWQ
ncbi:hypothetical protein SAMN02745244_02872 [Tessaracoccus bendigoensis DSM 12906]|uniref:Uncharacterized protein n=1 Tax=Tessaracoccus bendigoensis DSM 12906 TaxID=1123357 RepID=A0A1M6KNB2_9ACTN|nr:hypothetical protein [Tessaracoccus bendigoensis]SHJ60425.1 hypothetical protein SAMN02745244_02872 [Tessaracoccus bendigoensis DSM 12906]